MRSAVLAVAAMLAAAPTLRAGVVYDERENVVWVTGFSAARPATLDAVLAADAENGWGRMRREPDTEVCTLDASLRIGDDAGSTFLRIGRRERPRETLVVKGNVWIKPPRKAGARPDGTYTEHNRLTLGDPDDPAVRATLKIACSHRAQYGLFMGELTRKQATYGGNLHVYNSTITAAVQDAEHMLRGAAWVNGIHTGLYGNHVRLINATVSWVDGTACFGAQAHNSTIQGTTFEHCGGVFNNGRLSVRDCVFRNVGVVVAEGGCLDATLTRCTFADNGLNWTLGSVASQGVTLIDCSVGPQKQPVVLRRNRITPLEAVKRGAPIYPCCTELATLVVKVTDHNGQPIPDAAVSIVCPQTPDAVRNGFARTNAAGLTPDDTENGRLLITRRKLQATDAPNEPKEFSYSYQTIVRAQGHPRKRTPLPPDQPPPNPLVIALEKQPDG